ncbi:MAG: thioredoxin-like domain-containing protein [Flavobacteriaceae bacterium]
MNKILLLTPFLLLLFSCSSSDKDQDTGAWFGGEIINPNAPHIILTRNERIIDTIPLDQDNRFLYRLDSVEKGIYNFVHIEYQIIYLEPGDSLMARLNTVDFDESLAFTGEGAERNNFMIDMFLYNEQENKKMPVFYTLPPDEFLPKLDSMRDVRVQRLKKFDKKNKPCKGFIEIAEANILYDYLLKREVYPYAHFGRGGKIDKNALGESYFDFRNKIDYNNQKLQTHYAYYRFLLKHFDYLAFEEYSDALPYNDESYIHINNKLKLIDDKVELDTLKNSLLRTSIRSHILSSKDTDSEQKALRLYLSLTSNETDKKEIKVLSETSTRLLPGNILPNLRVVNTTNQVQNIINIFKKPTVLYFWSLNSVNHYKNIHSKVDELRQKYPEFDFIALNTNENQDAWMRVIQRNNFNKEYEYRLNNPQTGINELIINNINKAMIIDKNGVIVDNHTNLFNTYFEQELLGHLNQ